ncbi:hypothetical protein JN535_01245 [Cellulosimicrobium cellulans]|nr:hypothetical protein [Cellulosimicrobium cellulans]
MCVKRFPKAEESRQNINIAVEVGASKLVGALAADRKQPGVAVLVPNGEQLDKAGLTAHADPTGIRILFNADDLPLQDRWCPSGRH